MKLTKQKLGWPLDPPFFIPEAALEHFRKAVKRGKRLEKKWNGLLADYAARFPDLKEELDRAIAGALPPGWDANIPVFAPDPKGMSTRIASSKVMNAIGAKLPSFLGGSADLDPSTFTALTGLGDFESPLEPLADRQGTAGGGIAYSGRNLHFGVREHGMGSVLNGMAAHGGTIPYGATFLIFSDYMRPPIRLAALMGLHVIYVYTHDSIALGEDGPTHQPVEQLLGLRSIPNMIVLRPADANETAVAWKIAVEHKEGPVALVLTRQNLPILDVTTYKKLAEGVRSGGYALAQPSADAAPDIILVATGSEVQLALAARDKLEGQGIRTRVVSLPSWNLFSRQTRQYQDEILPENVPMLAIEAGTPLGWQAYAGPKIEVIGVERFGASAPSGKVMNEYGFNIENVAQRAFELVQQGRKA